DYIYSPLARLVFVEDGNPGLNGTAPHPLSLSSINRNMSRITQSAAKAYVSGYRVRNATHLQDIFQRDYALLNRNVSVQYNQTSLVTNQAFLIAIGILDVVAVVIMAIIVFSMNTANMQLFSLQTLDSIYNKGIEGKSQVPSSEY